jgi:hypothetical protein
MPVPICQRPHHQAEDSRRQKRQCGDLAWHRDGRVQVCRDERQERAQGKRASWVTNGATQTAASIRPP